MKENLTRYIDLLFAGAPDAADIKQEILHNTLDRYDDLVAQGKTPQAAYQLAISGIGDINEILNSESQPVKPAQDEAMSQQIHVKPAWKKALQAIGICLYIMCPIPLFVLQNATGLCGLLTFVAIATALMVIAGGKEKKTSEDEAQETTPESQLRKAVKSIIWAIGLCVYFLLSFATQAWYITWIVFLIIGAAEGLVIACMDLKEAK